MSTMTLEKPTLNQEAACFACGGPFTTEKPMMIPTKFTKLDSASIDHPVYASAQKAHECHSRCHQQCLLEERHIPTGDIKTLCRICQWPIEPAEPSQQFAQERVELSLSQILCGLFILGVLGLSIFAGPTKAPSGR